MSHSGNLSAAEKKSQSTNIAYTAVVLLSFRCSFCRYCVHGIASKKVMESQQQKKMPKGNHCKFVCLKNYYQIFISKLFFFPFFHDWLACKSENDTGFSRLAHQVQGVNYRPVESRQDLVTWWTTRSTRWITSMTGSPFLPWQANDHLKVEKPHSVAFKIAQKCHCVVTHSSTKQNPQRRNEECTLQSGSMTENVL